MASVNRRKLVVLLMATVNVALLYIALQTWETLPAEERTLHTYLSPYLHHLFAQVESLLNQFLLLVQFVGVILNSSQKIVHLLVLDW